MLKKILAIVALLFAVLLIVIATRPAQFRVVRSAQIAAAPEVVFPLIDDFHAWSTWSPWEKIDPNLKREYSGAPRGKGAAYAWSGNDQVGSGSMTITDSQTPERIEIRLEFKEPFEATNLTTFGLKPAASGTNVEWAMVGDNNFVGKAMSLFMDMDQMVGKDFEQGLSNLNAAAEARAKSASVQAP
jgi:uncharacterized protein YndB with AHSA1/START domain